MKENEEKAIQGLNQILEIINAKGDDGEINNILERSSKDIETENPKPEN